MKVEGRRMKTVAVAVPVGSKGDPELVERMQD